MTLQQLSISLGLPKKFLLETLYRNKKTSQIRETQRFEEWNAVQKHRESIRLDELAKKNQERAARGQRPVEEKQSRAHYINRKNALIKGLEILSIPDIEDLCMQLNVMPKRITDTFNDPRPTPKFASIPVDAPSRPPVVTIMGHVDHGKTTLLDTIRKTDVAAHEAGGITQHIGAFEVRLADGQTVTFVDTPGHEAFVSMRAAGANVTDIVVLVVAADDGVQPQTIEAIEHAKAANVPIVVAINKIDKSGTDPETITNQLLQHGVVSDELGGDVQMIPISGKTGLNIERLLEAVLLQAELMSLRAPHDCPAEAFIIENRIDSGKGNVSSVIVQRGCLKTGQWVVAGLSIGRIRLIHDDRGNLIEEASPGKPVEICGLRTMPRVGESVIVVESESRAEEIVEHRFKHLQMEREIRADYDKIAALDSSGPAPVSAPTSEMVSHLKTIPILIKADVLGSLEALREILSKFPRKEVVFQIVNEGVGHINVSDLNMAGVLNAMVFGLNVKAADNAKRKAKEMNVTIKTYNIIYHLVDELKAQIASHLTPIEEEVVTAQAEVLQIFEVDVKKDTTRVCGAIVKEGTLSKKANQLIRVFRRGSTVGYNRIVQLRRFKDEVKEVKVGLDCGIMLESGTFTVRNDSRTRRITAFEDIRQGDVLQVYETRIVPRTFESLLQSEKSSKK